VVTRNDVDPRHCVSNGLVQTGYWSVACRDAAIQAGLAQRPVLQEVPMRQTQDPPDGPRSIAEICRIVRMIELGGGQFLGFQPGGTEYLALFSPRFPYGTLALPLSSVSVDTVREKIAFARRANVAAS
jgi:hypothetical protein